MVWAYDEKMRIPKIPHTKIGMETPNKASVVTDISAIEYGCLAEYTPMNIARNNARANALSWSLRVSIVQGIRRVATG